MSEPASATGIIVAFWKSFWVIVILAAVCAAIFGLGWKLHWWLAQSTVNHQTQIIQNSDSNQRTLVADLTEKIGDVSTATVQIDQATGQARADLHAQRLGFARQACQDAAQISVPLHDGQGAWVRRNCAAGTVSPSSPLERN